MSAVQHTAPLRVAIVGAGPVGLATALQLRRFGLPLQVEVFDAQPDPAAGLRDPRVLALSDGSRQLLAGIQAWPQAAATAITRIHVSQLAAGLAALPRTQLQAADSGLPALGYTVRYGDLLAALQQAAATASIPIHYGCPVRAENAGGGVLLHPAGAATLGLERFDLALLAEGGAFHNQAARRLHRDYRQTALVGSARCEQPHRGLAIERFTTQGPVALLPCGPDYALVWCVAPERVDAILGMSPQAQRAALQALLPAACGKLVELRISGHFPLGLNAELSARDGRLLQLGNAAQTLHPVAGQGLNLGLRDSAALVDLLLRAGSSDLDALLRRYDRSRLPDRVALLGLTDLLAQAFTWDFPAAAGLRGIGLGLLEALPPLKRALQQRMVFGWRG